jgi:hypothetical protein
MAGGERMILSVIATVLLFPLLVIADITKKYK